MKHHFILITLSGFLLNAGFAARADTVVKFDAAKNPPQYAPVGRVHSGDTLRLIVQHVNTFREEYTLKIDLVDYHTRPNTPLPSSFPGLIGGFPQAAFRIEKPITLPETAPQEYKDLVRAFDELVKAIVTEIPGVPIGQQMKNTILTGQTNVTIRWKCASQALEYLHKLGVVKDADYDKRKAEIADNPVNLDAEEKPDIQAALRDIQALSLLFTQSADDLANNIHSLMQKLINAQTKFNAQVLLSATPEIYAPYKETVANIKIFADDQVGAAEKSIAKYHEALAAAQKLYIAVVDTKSNPAVIELDRKVNQDEAVVTVIVNPISPALLDGDAGGQAFNRGGPLLEGVSLMNRQPFLRPVSAFGFSGSVVRDSAAATTSRPAILRAGRLSQRYQAAPRIHLARGQDTGAQVPEAPPDNPGAPYTKTIRTPYRWVFDVSGGLAGTNLGQPNYITVPKTVGSTVQSVVANGARNNYDVGGAVLASYYLTTPRDIGVGPCIGIVQGDNTRYLVGLSLVLGNRNRLMFSFGAAFGNVSRLNGDTLGQPANNGVSAATASTLRAGTFVGLTYRIHF